jgi:hypothetical protein
VRLSAFLCLSVSWSALLPNDAARQLVQPLVSEFVGTVQAVAPRSSKWGDFRPAHAGKPARIRVNRDLPADAFLLTLLHELAHAHVETDWQKRRDAAAESSSAWSRISAVLAGKSRRIPRPAPHGKEWQQAYQRVVAPFLEARVFQPEVAAVLARSMRKPKASCGADPALLAVLRPRAAHQQNVADLPEGASFRLASGRTFVKGPRRRTRISCIEIPSGRTFAVHPLAEVVWTNSPPPTSPIS